MNRTLLLIICDFLLLNLLALTRWERVEPVPTQAPPVPRLQANATARETPDLVDAMRLVLEQERAARDQLQERLQFTEADVTAREQMLAEARAQKERLESSLSQAQGKADELARRFAAASQAATQSQEKVARLEQSLASRQAEVEKQRQALAAQAEKDRVEEQAARQLQQALAEKEAELERQRNALSFAEQERDAAILQATQFAAAVKVAEKERDLLRENVSHLKDEVAVVRQEKAKLHAQTEELTGGVTQLASGVTQLVAKAGNLAEEVRANVPVNMNVMFNEFLSNRVDVAVSAVGPGLFGSTLRQEVSKTVLVRDGTNVCAPLHVTETPFSLVTPATGMSVVSATVSRAGRETAKGPLRFWSQDPRVAMVAVEPSEAAEASVKIYEPARNPFRFTEAVLISRGGRYYGEVEFKLDPRTPDYVRMKNRLFSRVFGEFSPSTGDLVLSKTGEFLGIMVNADYCAVVKRFNSHPGDSFDANTVAPQMRVKLEEFRRRIDRLPLALR